MRFTQPAYPTVYFSDKIWVKCPDCGGMGRVETEPVKNAIPFSHSRKSTFCCTKCSLTQQSDEKWFGYFQGFVERSCGFCGTHICYSTQPTKEPYELVMLKCDACKKEKDYALNWYRYKVDKPTDPYFGLELWLQIDIKDNILWMYNMDHLLYLKDYVAAKLREDDGRHKYSMITNLPQWVKSAKNRALILKKIERLEKEMGKKS